MAESAEELRRDIEYTRHHMGNTLEAIGDRVSPGRIIERRRNRLVDGFSRMRHSVMGSAQDAVSTVGEQMSDMREAVSDGVSGMADTVAHSPGMARSQAQGSPFAAGLIAFGAGLLAATLIPPSEPEKQLADKVKQAAEPLMEPAQEAAASVASRVQERGQEALEQIKESATTAAQNVKETATSNAQDTKDAGQSAAHQLTDRASSP